MDESFEEDIKEDSLAPQAFHLQLDGFEGPIDLLLHLAREHKIDLKTLSILDLARQYIAFIENATNLKLEIAAEYLVMAAWLAYLKSRLLLPAVEAALNPEQQDDAQAMADALARQLRHLELLQDLSHQIQGRVRLGQDVFTRGMPEGLRRTKKMLYGAGTLFELLRAYGDMAQRRQPIRTYEPITHKMMDVEEAMDRLIDWVSRVLGKPRGDVWLPLDAFLPRLKSDSLHSRGQRVAFLSAGLELAKRGAIELRQDNPFTPIMMRAKGE